MTPAARVAAAAEILAEQVRHVVDPPGALSADVRRNDHVGHLPQRALRRQRLGVGLGLADLFRDRVGIVRKVDPAHLGRFRLRHLARTVTQAHHAGRRALDDRLGQGEELAVLEAGRVRHDVAQGDGLVEGVRDLDRFEVLVDVRVQVHPTLGGEAPLRQLPAGARSGSRLRLG